MTQTGLLVHRSAAATASFIIALALVILWIAIGASTAIIVA